VSRRVVWLLAISSGCIVANLYYAQPLLADMAREFALSVTEIGAVAMLGNIGSAVGMLLFVPLGDKQERRGLISLLLAGGAVTLAAMALATSAFWLCVASFLLGTTTACVHVIVPLAAHLAPASERGRAVGTVISGLLVGVLLARTFSGVFGDHFGWRAVYWVAALVMLTLAVVVRLMLPESRPDDAPGWVDLMASIVTLARQHAVVREAALIAFLMFSSFAALWTTLVFLLRTPPYDFGTTAAGMFGLLGAASATAAPLVGRVSDRFSAGRVVLLAIVTTLVGYLVLALAGRTLPGLIAAIILIDAGVQSCHVANQSRIYAVAPHARGRLNTVYMVAFMSGGAAGAYIGPFGLQLGGWGGFCAFPIAALAVAILFAAAAQSANGVRVTAARALSGSADDNQCPPLPGP
jgi:predicted MFS family arabinose efflux permease